MFDRPGRRWLVRCAAAFVLLGWGLGACVPGLEGTEATGQRIGGAPAVRLLASDGVDLRALSGASATATLRLDNPRPLAHTVVLRSTDPFVALGAGRVTLAPNARREVGITARCGEAPSVRRAWVVVDGDGGSEAFSVRLVCSDDEAARVAAAVGAEAAPATTGPDGPLTWEPPPLERPEVVYVTQDGRSEYELETHRDYLVLLPPEPLRRGFTLRGGRNVVLIGGEIDIPHRGPDAGVGPRRALHLADATGTVHVEGMLMHGEDISEGIQVAAPDAIVQIQNVGIFGIRARDQVGFTDNHPDLIQSYGNVGELRVDRFSGSTDYQGFFFVADYHGPAHGPVDLRRVHIVGDPTARYLLWFSVHPDAADARLEDVWLDVPPERSGGLGRSVWPDVQGDPPAQAQEVDDGDAVGWPDGMRPRVHGVVRAGTPPTGTFVRPEDVGVGYASPGYALPSRSPAAAAD